MKAGNRAPSSGAAGKSQSRHKAANVGDEEGRPGPGGMTSKERRQISLPHEQSGTLSDVQLEALIRAQGKRVPMQQWEIDAFVGALQKRQALDKGLAIVYEYAGRLDSIKTYVDRQSVLFNEAMLAAPTKQRGTSPQAEAEFSLLFSAMVDMSVSVLREISLLRRLQWCPRPILCNSTSATADRKEGASTRLTFQANLRRQTLSILEAISGSMGGHLLDVLSPLHLAVFLAPSLSFEQAAAYFHMQESEHPPHDDHYHLIEQLFIAVRNILYLEDGVASLYRSFHPKGAGASKSEATYNTFPLLRMVYQGYTFPTTQFRWFWDAGAVYRTSSDVVYFSMSPSSGVVHVSPNADSRADQFFESYTSQHAESSVDDVSYTVPASQYFGDEAAILPMPDGAVSISGVNSLVDVSVAGAAEEWARSSHLDERIEALRDQELSLAQFHKEKQKQQVQVRHELVRQWSHEANQAVALKVVDQKGEALARKRQEEEQEVRDWERARSDKEIQERAEFEREIAMEETGRIARAETEKQRQRQTSYEEEEERAAASRRRAAEMEQAEQEIAQLRRLRAIADEERRANRERRQLEEEEEERRAKQRAERNRREEHEASKAAAELKRLEAVQNAKAAKAAVEDKKLLDKAVIDKKKADREEALRVSKEKSEKKKQPLASASAKKTVEMVPVALIPVAAEEESTKVQDSAAKKLVVVAPKSPTSAAEKKNSPARLLALEPPPAASYEDKGRGSQWGNDDPGEYTTIISTPSTPHKDMAANVMSETLTKIFQATPTKQLSSPEQKPKSAVSLARPITMPQVSSNTPGRLSSDLHGIPQAPVNQPLSPTRMYSPISPKKRPAGTPTERARLSRSMEMLEIYGSLQHPYTRAEARSESQVLQIALRQVVLENTGKNLLQLAARKISAWWKLMGPRKIFWRRWRVRNTVLSILDDVVSRAVLYSSKRRRLRARLLRNGATITLQRWYRVLWNQPRQAGSKAGKPKVHQARIAESHRNEYFESPPISPTVNFPTFSSAGSASAAGGSSAYPDAAAGAFAGSPTRLSMRSEDNLSPLGMSPAPSRVSKSFTYGSTSRRPSSPGLDGARSSFYDVLRAKKRSLVAESSKFNLRLGSKKLAALLIQCMVRKKLSQLRVKKIIEAKRNDKRKVISRASLLDPKFAQNYAAVMIQRIARGKLARNFVVKLLQASRVLNKLYRKTVAFGNLRRSLRRIDRPLTLTIRSIRNMPAFVYNTHEFLNLKVSIYWSPLLHIMPIDDAKSFITSSLPQFTVTFPHLNMERIYSKEEQEAMAKATPTEGRGLFSMGSFEKSPHSPHSPDGDADSDGDSSSSEDEEERAEEETKKKLFNAEAFSKMRKKFAKSKFMKQFVKSIRTRKAKRTAIPPGSHCMAVFDDACIKIPACHGNSIVKFDIFNELQKKVYSAFLHLGTRGRLMFWKEEMEVPLTSSAARRSGAPASKNKAEEPLEPIIELLACTGLPLRSRCGWAKVKIQGHGPLKRSIASKSGSSVSSFIFETWHRVYLSLDGLSLSMFDSKGSSNALNSIPAKHFASVTADKGQIFGGDGGSLAVKVEDNYDVSLRVRKNYEVLIFR